MKPSTATVATAGIISGTMIWPKMGSVEQPSISRGLIELLLVAGARQHLVEGHVVVVAALLAGVAAGAKADHRALAVEADHAVARHGAVGAAGHGQRVVALSVVFVADRCRPPQGCCR